MGPPSHVYVCVCVCVCGCVRACLSACLSVCFVSIQRFRAVRLEAGCLGCICAKLDVAR